MFVTRVKTVRAKVQAADVNFRVPRPKPWSELPRTGCRGWWLSVEPSETGVKRAVANFGLHDRSFVACPRLGFSDRNRPRHVNFPVRTRGRGNFAGELPRTATISQPRTGPEQYLPVELPRTGP